MQTAISLFTFSSHYDTHSRPSKASRRVGLSIKCAATKILIDVEFLGGKSVIVFHFEMNAIHFEMSAGHF